MTIIVATPVMGIESYSLLGNYPTDRQPMVDVVVSLAQEDTRPFEQLGALQIVTARQGEIEVNYGLAPVALAYGLTDEDGQCSGPNMTYYLAYEDETGAMVGAHVIGERIEYDEQGGAALVYRVVDENTWNSLRGIEEQGGNLLSLGQPILVITLKDGVDAQRAREVKALLSGSGGDLTKVLSEYALGVTFIQPNQPELMIMPPVEEANWELLAGKLFANRPAQSLGLEATSTPMPVAEEQIHTPTSTQESVSMVSSELTNGIANIPDIIQSNPELLEYRNPTSLMASLSRALGISPEELISHLRYEVRSDKLGDAYCLYLDPVSGYAVAIAEKNPDQARFEWKEATLLNVKPEDIRIASTGQYQLAPILARHFGSYSGGYAFRWIELEPTFGKVLTGGLSKEVAVAKSVGPDYSGNHLVWGNPVFLPDWLKNDLASLSNDDLKALLKQHITDVVNITKGRVIQYSVVNEPLGNKLSNPNKFTRLGKTDEEHAEWIGEMVKAADAGDFMAEQIINDTDIEFGGPKSDRIFNIVRIMKENGVPLDGIGFQMHINAAEFTGANLQINLDKLREQIRRFHDTGVQVHVTEFDIDTHDTGSNRDELQTRILDGIMTVCLEEGVTDFTFFSGLDEYSWLIKEYKRNNAQATLLTKDGPKLSYFMAQKKLLAVR